MTDFTAYAEQAVKDTFRNRRACGVEEGFDCAQAYVNYEIDGDAGDQCREPGEYAAMCKALRAAYERRRTMRLYARFYR